MFGNQAPDSGNSELIAIAGTEEQKAQWMWPLLESRISSAFAMTEQGTGSDPTQIKCRAERVGDEWVVNGKKWFVTNADRADVHILMALTTPEAAKHERFSMLIVPRDTPGITTRPFGVLSDPDMTSAWQEECEVFYDDVRIPAANLLGGEGQGFALAQKRLGPGRIHHCMRWIGVCNRAFDMLCERAVSNSVHGRAAVGEAVRAGLGCAVRRRDRRLPAAHPPCGLEGRPGRRLGGAQRDRDDQVPRARR